MASPASLADVALVLRARAGTDFLSQSVGSLSGVDVSRASSEAAAALSRHSSFRGVGGLDG
jgi:hypothetical protein